MIKILFLGYSKNKTKLISFLKSKKNIQIKCHNKKITGRDIKKQNLVICFGYRHIIDPSVLENNSVPIINLHIGFLPYNRGSHPNFWAFAENTPSGVTIHKVEKKIDSGNIIYQKLIDFKLLENRKKLTFSNTYDLLISEIENLFINNFDNIIKQKYKTFEQIGKGSIHKKNELPYLLKSWDQNIYITIRKFNSQQKRIMKKNLGLIHEIENTRKNNNINWMNIIRTGLKSSSLETLKILKQINSDDDKISKLFEKLNNNEK